MQTVFFSFKLSLSESIIRSSLPQDRISYALDIYNTPYYLYKAIAEILIFVYKLKKTTTKEQAKVQKAAMQKGDIQATAELQKKKEESLKKFRNDEQNEV